MLEAYSLDVSIPANSSIPFNVTSLIKGCTATHPSVSSFNLNKCGVYMVYCNCSSEADATIQLFKDGVAQPQAQSVGGMNPSFLTLVQVDHNNSCCACDSPVVVDIRNTGEAEVTMDAHIVITKLI